MTADETRTGGPAETFPLTRWSVVLAAGDPRTPAGAEALEQLARAYWKPVYAYLRRRGLPVEDAKDLTQDFFEALLRRNLPGRADRAEGRFRTFLLASLMNFLRDARDREAAEKRGGGRRREAIDLEAVAPEDLEIPGPEAETPEEAYHRQWALGLMRAALEDLRRRYAAEGKDLRARLFERYVDLVSGGGGVDYAALAGEFGCSVTDVTNYLHRARRLYRELLRARVRDSVARPEEVEEEIRDLRKFLG